MNNHLYGKWEKACTHELSQQDKAKYSSYMYMYMYMRKGLGIFFENQEKPAATWD